ncbi:protein Spt10p [Monosporozyma servazzii]
MTKIIETTVSETLQDNNLVLTPLQPHTILLNDEETIATMYPIPCDASLFPNGLLSFILDEFNMEIGKGVSFPYYEALDQQQFKDIWFQRDGHFCIMVLGEIPELDYGMIKEKTDLRNNYGTIIETQRHTEQYLMRKNNKNMNLNIQWEKQCLGVFSLQPAYPGRSSHISTGTFLVNAGIRGKGIGKALADTFLEWAKVLGFTSAYFPLVYGTNVGMRCILEELNFRRVGMLPSSAILKGFDIPIDSFIYEKELTSISKNMDMFKYHDKTDFIGKYERMLYYMEHKKYPKDCNKSEKARIRMQSKHHTLRNGKLMFKDKEVVYDPVKQSQLVLEEHLVEHGGINKVSNKLSKKYHWNGIKNTVTDVLSQCTRCKSRYSDDTGVIVTSNSNTVKQAHMLPNRSVVTQGLVTNVNETHKEYHDKLAHLATVIEKASIAEQQKENHQSQQQDAASQYDGPTPKDKVELVQQQQQQKAHGSTVHNNSIDNNNNNKSNNNNNRSLAMAAPPDQQYRATKTHGTRKRTYESALQHGLLSKQSNRLTQEHTANNNNNNNNNTNNNNTNNNNAINNNVASDFNINETIDMNMRSLNKIVEEEERKKRPRLVDSDPDESSDAVYAFSRVSSRINSPQKDDTNVNNNNNNNKNGNFNLDPNIMETFNINQGIYSNATNSTNIPLDFDFDEDYIEAEDADYEEPDLTSTNGKEEDGEEEEQDEDGEDDPDYAQRLAQEEIIRELQSLQPDYPDDGLSFHSTLP